jgi:aspartyl-tRNA(Asn)/glutamyl-tRNA(Gln) amidotransferase subunit B
MTKFLAESAISPELLAKYEPVIGLEVHAQLLTKSKIFCGCSTRFGDPPNSNVCPVCLGLPGTLPVLNKRAVEIGMRAALALNCAVHEHSRFARKNYFYPDLPKGYQISQYELPLATGGWVETEHDGKTKRIGITRLHLEEDAGKSLHDGFPHSDEKTYVDFNRCGTPLSEIVSEPDMRSPDEAYAYLTTLRQILLYTGVSDCNMEEGSLRCDANVSVRLRGVKEFGTKVEVKNLNSFRYLAKALEFEIERHISILESGGRIAQETRLWNQAAGHTDSMRSKEKAHDYRYFPEPDLLPVHVGDAWRESVRSSLPELPVARRARFVSAFGVTPYDAEVLTDTQSLASYFESVVTAGAPGKAAANWMQTELLRRLNDSGKEITASPVGPAALAELVKLVESGKITAAVGKKVFATMFETGRSAAEIVVAEGLGAQVGDDAIEQLRAKSSPRIRTMSRNSSPVMKGYSSFLSARS